MIFWPFPGWPEIAHFELFMRFWGVGRVSIELTAPLTFILTKFQPEKCHMVHVPTIFHNLCSSDMHPGQFSGDPPESMKIVFLMIFDEFGVL